MVNLSHEKAVTRWCVMLALMILGACDTKPRPPEQGSVPVWLGRLVSADGRYPPVIEEARYRGKPVFELIATDRADTGDEHAVYSEDGRMICRFGGYAPEVTAGSCDIGEIKFVRTVYEPSKP